MAHFPARDRPAGDLRIVDYVGARRGSKPRPPRREHGTRCKREWHVHAISRISPWNTGSLCAHTWTQRTSKWCYVPAEPESNCKCRDSFVPCLKSLFIPSFPFALFLPSILCLITSVRVLCGLHTPNACHGPKSFIRSKSSRTSSWINSEGLFLFSNRRYPCHFTIVPACHITGVAASTGTQTADIIWLLPKGL